jgi:hypothetical protein
MIAMRRLPLLLCLVAVLAATGVLAGAGSSARSGGPSPNVWATKICTSIKVWQKNIVRRSNAVSHVKPKNLRVLHDAFVAFLNGVVRDTDVMIVQTKAAGTPNASHGAAVANALQIGFKKLRGFFASDAARAKRLSSTNAKKFAKGAQAIAATIDRQSKEITAIFDSLDKKFRSPELDKAMKTVPACRGIG